MISCFHYGRCPNGSEPSAVDRDVSTVHSPQNSSRPASDVDHHDDHDSDVGEYSGKRSNRSELPEDTEQVSRLCPPWTCHLCAVQIQKLAEHKGAMSTMSPLCSHFLRSLGQNWTCHQSMCARSPLKQQKITENFCAPERLG